MKRFKGMLMAVLTVALMVICLTACQNSSEEEEAPVETEILAEEEDSDEGIEEAVKEATGMGMTINGTEVSVLWEENDTVREIMEATPFTIEMSMYGDWEQFGSFGRNFSTNDVQQTANPGDLMLYQGDKLVIFYGSNTWAYTRLGSIQGMTEEELSKILSSGDVTITITQ